MTHCLPLWKRGLGGFIFIFLFASIAQAVPKERDYQVPWCEAHGGQVEVRIKGGRIDCVTRTHVIEFDWAYKWAEGKGQASFYASEYPLRRFPGVVLILKKPKDFRHVYKLLKAIRSDRRKWAVWIIWGWSEMEEENGR